MARAFGTVDDCVQDSVVSACGAYPSAPLPRILDAIATRQERYFNDQGTPVTLTNTPDWRRTVRRALFCSPRFAVVHNATFATLEVLVAERAPPVRWYYYDAPASPSGARTASPARCSQSARSSATRPDSRAGSVVEHGCPSMCRTRSLKNASFSTLDSRELVFDVP